MKASRTLLLGEPLTSLVTEDSTDDGDPEGLSPRIPRARLVTIEAGGDFLHRHDTEVREAIGNLVGELT